MGRSRKTSRLLLLWTALLPLLPGCQSIPAPVSLPPTSSLLAMDVLFPIPRSRDPSLVQVFLVRGAIRVGMEALPELIPATFVKNSRAYLLDPEPGTYSLVAVTCAVAAPLEPDPVAGGVRKATRPGTLANAVIFPAELIDRTRTAVAPGGVAFMGALRVRPGDRVNANAVFRDELQPRIAERIHPGATARSGLSGWFTDTWLADLEETSFSNGPWDRESFFDAALTDLAGSPWTQVVARAAPRKAPAARASAPARAPKSAAPIAAVVTATAQPAFSEPEITAAQPEAETPEPERTAARPEATTPEPEVAAVEPETATPEPERIAARPEAATPEPEVAAVEPETATPELHAYPSGPEHRRFPGIPTNCRLSEIKYGMGFEEVREVLGEPDDKVDRLTARSWIPFYSGRGARLRDWIYKGEGRVVFSLQQDLLGVIDVVFNPDEGM
jgi:hypothetical protein